MENYEIVFGYGSLMSLHGVFGLFRGYSGIELLPIRILDLRIIHMPIGRRGLAKPIGGGITMDIDDFELRGRYVSPRYEPDDGFVGVGIVVHRGDFVDFCGREGYWLGGKLLEKSTSKGCSVGEYLHSIARRISPDGILDTSNVRRYRKLLCDEIGGSSKHYLPHPLVVDGDVAIVFIAPGRYGTGTKYERGKKEELDLRVMSVKEYYDRYLTRPISLLGWRPSKFHLERYLAECLLGGVHGVNVRDLVEPLLGTGDDLLVENIRRKIGGGIYKEIMMAIELISNQDYEEYYRRFGDPKINIRATGLSLIETELPRTVELRVKKAPRELDRFEKEGLPVIVISDYLKRLIGSQRVKIVRRIDSEVTVEALVFSISEFKEYSERCPTIAKGVRLGEYMLANKPLREHLKVSIEDRITIFLNIP